MNCIWDWCEVINIVFGGLVMGIAASFAYYYLVKWNDHRKFKERYSYLKSKYANDWIGHSMQSEDGRREDFPPNGDKMTIDIEDEKIILTVQERGRGEWVGVLRMESPEFGTATYKYETMYEFGRADCMVGTVKRLNATFDYIFVVRTTNRLYYLEEVDSVVPERKQFNPHYIYGDELFLRIRM
jgi:hypothetical protein